MNKTLVPCSSWRRFTLIALLNLSLFSASVFGWQGQSLAPAGNAALLTAAEQEAVASVQAETIREAVVALSAPAMEGRGTGQPGGDRAAQYLADRFSKLNLKPLGDKNSYLQNIKFRETLVTPESTLKAGEETLVLGRDYVVTPPFSGDENLSGKMVFVAYGLTSKSPKRDDLAGVNVAGKIVVLLDGPPKGVRKEDWKKAKAGQQIMTRLFVGGAAAVMIAGTGDELHPYAETADYLVRRQVELASEGEFPAEAPPFVLLSDTGAEKLFAGSEMTYAQARAKAEAGEFASINLKQTAKITVRLKKGKGTSSNVVGYLEGSDPKLKDEAVVYTAHYDAYGMGADGRIYPGAADNALGVGELIAVAEAFTKSPARPKRSIIFLLVTGEEYGLYGAEHWVKNPTWKIERVAANLNLDGIGTEVYGPVKRVVGFGLEHSDLGATLTDVVAATGNRIAPDPMPEEKSFYRSDHYAFVKKGVPALMLMGAPDGETGAWVARARKWLKTDYHQPTDTVRPDWSWEGARTIAVVTFLTGLRVANADALPAWLPSSPFNRKRGTNEPPPQEP
ncbi:MAG: M20/M25/M40 family metallo-hydrolase [Pyrinomonadaceae bacterium]